ncbi:MAG TPA: hypothetical protein DEV64_08280 [Rhodospirillaceae bacterium]|nr:hypothetical protein [Rhodospirillaceae bacterium]
MFVDDRPRRDRHQSGGQSLDIDRMAASDSRIDQHRHRQIERRNLVTKPGFEHRCDLVVGYAADGIDTRRRAQ